MINIGVFETGKDKRKRKAFFDIKASKVANHGTVMYHEDGNATGVSACPFRV